MLQRLEERITQVPRSHCSYTSSVSSQLHAQPCHLLQGFHSLQPRHSFAGLASLQGCNVLRVYRSQPACCRLGVTSVLNACFCTDMLRQALHPHPPSDGAGLCQGMQDAAIRVSCCFEANLLHAPEQDLSRERAELSGCPTTAPAMNEEGSWDSVAFLQLYPKTNTKDSLRLNNGA